MGYKINLQVFCNQKFKNKFKSKGHVNSHLINSYNQDTLRTQSIILTTKLKKCYLKFFIGKVYLR